MALTELLSLPSSPPRQFTTFDMSSSPPLPSLTDLIKKKAEPILSHSRVASIPASASTTFTSAGSRSVPDGVDAPHIMLETEKDTTTKNEDPKPVKAKPRKAVAKKVEVLAQHKVAKAPRKSTSKPRKDDGDGAGEPEQDPEPKKVRKPRAKKVVVGQDVEGTEKVVVPRKPRVKKSDRDPAADVVTKEKPARKPRAKKSEDGSQTKLAKGKVTKATTKTKSRVSSGKSATKEPSNPQLDPFTDPAGFGLVDAVRRRVNWTPPPQSGKTTLMTSLDTEALACLLASGGSDASTEGKKGFTNLLGNFGFTKAGEFNAENKPQILESTRKRKLIELFKATAPTAGVTSPKKEKAPKKKPRTITDQAMSAYIDNGEAELPSNPTPLLQYLALDSTGAPTNDGFKIPPKPRSRSPAKNQTKAKKGTAQAPILLSPESALKQARNQDYVFGTSSQLAREDSPTLLRDLHEAMQASNEADVFDHLFTDELPRSDALTKPSKTALSTKRNLWSAAARDPDGELMEVEMLNPANSSPINPRASDLKVPNVIPLPDPIEEWPDIEDFDHEPPMELDPKKTVPVNGRPIDTSIHGLSSSPQTSLTKKSPAKLHVARDPKVMKTAAPTSDNGAKSIGLKAPKRPDFSTYTTVKLQKEIASYGFKPIKGRNQMIALLERCWESKHGSVLVDMDTNATLITPASSIPPPSNQAAAVSLKRPRGRPRKDATIVSPPKVKRRIQSNNNAVEDLELDSDTLLSQIRTPKKASKKTKGRIEEIEDSDGLITPSPPRRQGSQAGTPPIPLQFVAKEDADLSPDSLQSLLFSHISRAIQNAPPGKGSQTPSWHEKILLYDPIILEDLAVWLNTGALQKVGWDGEVAPKEVKKWCESKSICCLWRENLRGGARSRY